MLRFWTMLAHYHGQVWSAAPFAQSMGVSEPTIRRYLDTLTQTLMLRGQQRIGVEFKRADAPRITTSMRIALDDLKLDALYVVYPGRHRYRLSDRVEVVPLWALLPAAVAV